MTAPVDRAAAGPSHASIPPAMQSAKRWLHWAAEPRNKADGTPTVAKVPYYADGSRRVGDLDADAARLVDMRTALLALELYGPARAGLGFALGADGQIPGMHWQGVDFDHVADRPHLAPLLDQMPGYVELSPSGTGAHVLGLGQPFDALGSNGSGIEAYSRGRFFTVTARPLRAGQLVDLSAHVPTLRAAHELHAARRPGAGPLLGAPVLQSDDRVLSELADALRYLDADDRDTWIAVGHELHALGEAGYKLWAAWSATAPRFPGGDDLERWHALRSTRTGYAGVFVRAQAAGWKNPRKMDLAALDWSPLEKPSFEPLPEDEGVVGETRAPAAGQVVPFPSPPLMQPMATGLPASVPPVPERPAERIDGQIFRTAEGTQRVASIENVIDALQHESAPRLVFDTFQGAIMIPDGGEYRPLEDVDRYRMRAVLGRGGFKPVGDEVMRSAISVVAHDRQVDTARQWGDSLRWDGVPRIDTAMPRYYGCEDTPYTRAVGAYAFTALAGRLLEHPLQCDMAVILVGLQGAGKTSAVRALAPFPRAFGEIDLSKRDTDLSRHLRGKLVLEWAEMRGLTGRDNESIKAWITRQTEEWTPKYLEFETSFDRRCIIFGTANTTELLDDPTGERRWLPLETGRTDIAALRRDVRQLWAEGVARFKVGGVEWELAESLAKGEHWKFKIHDEWSEPIQAWLDSAPVVPFGQTPPVPTAAGLTNGMQPFTLLSVVTLALNLRVADIKRSDELRVAKILRNLGYDKRLGRFNGKVSKRWVAVGQG